MICRIGGSTMDAPETENQQARETAGSTSGPDAETTTVFRLDVRGLATEVSIRMARLNLIPLESMEGQAARVEGDHQDLSGISPPPRQGRRRKRHPLGQALESERRLRNDPYHDAILRWDDTDLLDAAIKYHIPVPGSVSRPGSSIFRAVDEGTLLQLRRDVTEAKRESREHMRGWIALGLALLFGLVGAISTAYSVLVLRPKIDTLSERVRQMEIKLASTDGLSERIRQLEVTAAASINAPNGSPPKPAKRRQSRSRQPNPPIRNRRLLVNTVVCVCVVGVVTDQF